MPKLPTTPRPPMTEAEVEALRQDLAATGRNKWNDPLEFHVEMVNAARALDFDRLVMAPDGRYARRIHGWVMALGLMDYVYVEA